MKVILKKDVKDLGKVDQMVDVSDGYAKNYLIPRGIAVAATPANITDMKNKQAAAAARAKKELELANESAGNIKDKTVVVKVKCGENGKLFGAISTKDISDAIEKQLHLTVDKKKIQLDEPIKAIGNHQVAVKFHSGVSAKINVKVEAE